MTVQTTQVLSESMTKVMTLNTTEEHGVKNRLESFYNDWMEMSFSNGKGFTEWWNQYFAKECPGIIRASGNPLSSQAWCKMISSDNVTYLDRKRNRIVSVDSCLIFADGKAAITVLTADMIFAYNDVKNEDRAKISLTWTKCEHDNQWRIVHFQRATGQPIPAQEEEQ
ncbi:expressed unknown protein [Seminavis robusta]|uniref:SnoaL-like domain-containing protein n=1 Tax=Seminavis robusta TaxID=568900 RepID=A0A9N8E5G8_9STRA|nr:expressed unknown protein [Seminavis robusta]|eukprot:Sro693_g188200.1 n/a (168) ;mRNA; f:6759-7354